MSKARYAIYYSPEAESSLWRFGARWLGRDPTSDDDMKRLKISGVKAKRVEEITEAPRVYGFHATLKPPFRLAKSCDLQMLDEALEGFIAGHEPFKVPALILSELDGFIALRPKKTCKDLNEFATDCVRMLDPFRAPMDDQEKSKRLKADLTKGQSKMLEKWGYPYVLDEYRFHMTLTERLSDAERQVVMAGLAKELDGVLTGKPWTFDLVTLMRQRKPGKPFEVVKCYSLKKRPSSRWPLKKH